MCCYCCMLNSFHCHKLQRCPLSQHAVELPVSLPDILNPPFLRLTSRKPLWLDLQPADVKSRWRHNWKSAQVVNCHLVCDPDNLATGFWPPSATVVSAETVFAWNRDTAVPAEGNGDLQTLMCVIVARPRRCPTLPNPVLWQSWQAAYPSYTLQMKTLFRSWPVMVHDTHTRRRRRLK